MKKKSLWITILCALCVACVAGVITLCIVNKPTDNDEGKINNEFSISFEEKNVDVFVNENVQLQVLASDGSSPSLQWSSSNELIAEVDENGLVKGISAGSAVIKAVTDDGVSALCNVTVGDETKSLLSVSLNRDAVSLYTGDSVAVNAVVKYGSTILQSVTPTWISANSNVASVDGSGNILGVAEGETEIIASAKYRNTPCEAKIKVTVYEEGVLISPDFATKTIIQGDNVNLSVSVMKDRTLMKNYDVTYTSSDESIATISGETLTAKKSGDVDITVNCAVDGQNYSFAHKLHIYGKYFVEFYSENDLVETKEYKYGEKVSIDRSSFSANRTLKYYLVNDIIIDDDSFVMPDEPVRVDAKYTNDTADNFADSFSTGTLFFSQAEIEFVKADLPIDSNQNQALGKGAVKFTASFGSKQFNFEEEVTITKSSVMRLRMYRPSSVALIYLGNEKDKTNPPVQIGNKGDLVKDDHYTVELTADCWEYVEIPLTCFGEVGTKLSAVSIACSSDYIYIDEISVTNIDTTDNFVNSLSDGTIFFSQAEIEFVKTGLPVDANGNMALGKGAVKLTGSWASKQFNFEEEVTITDSSAMRLRVYRPSSVALIYLGNEKDKTNPPVQIGNKGDLVKDDHYTVELTADCWEYVEIPLTCFGEVGTKLSAVSIACSSDYIYIDEITIVK